MTTHQKFGGKIRVETSNPSQPVEGDEYFNETEGTWMRYDGTHWRGVVVQTSTSTTTTSTSTSSTTTTSTSITTSTSTTTS